MQQCLWSRRTYLGAASQAEEVTDVVVGIMPNADRKPEAEEVATGGCMEHDQQAHHER